MAGRERRVVVPPRTGGLQCATRRRGQEPQHVTLRKRTSSIGGASCGASLARLCAEQTKTPQTSARAPSKAHHRSIRTPTRSLSPAAVHDATRARRRSLTASSLASAARFTVEAHAAARELAVCDAANGDGVDRLRDARRVASRTHSSTQPMARSIGRPCWSPWQRALRRRRLAGAAPALLAILLLLLLRCCCAAAALLLAAAP